MTHPHEPEPLRPLLQAAQSELAKHLDDACAHEDVDEESTAQLIQLEESLVDAAHAAKQAVSLRRRLRTGHGAPDADEPEDAEGDADESVDRRPSVERRADRKGATETSSVREFRDARGILWRAWAVIPQQLQSDRPGSTRLGEYSDGWLAFETEDASQRRRLPHHPADWAQRTNHALEQLLERAEPVRMRRKTAGDDADASPS
jgi:hypothetical protein